MGSYSSDVKIYTPGPKKRLGQHFLRDTGVIDRIIRWIQPRLEDIIIEIGAGKGALSVGLASKVFKLLAIEMDRDCIPGLESALKPFKSASIVHSDILQTDVEQLATSLFHPGKILRIVGNLPYNISTAIIDKFLHCSRSIHDMRFMVQTEVAQRIVASPRSRQYGYLSLLCQHYCDVKIGFKVSSSCFVPRPKVSSSMIALYPYKKQRNSDFEKDFELLGKAAFGYRRKTLSNSLGKHPVFSPICSALLQQASIDGTRRAEELSVKEFESLACVYHEKVKSRKPKVES
jgi:16S rRNA (adenine1518-N6/adenine1519-N6)-dimethyltransferase